MKCRRAWYKKKDRMKREASFNACLNLKTKMYLMGLNCNDSGVLTYKIVKKAIGNLSKQARENLARQEHYRWNAHYICNGYIPVSIKDFIECPDNGRDFKLRKHPNLLEFDALREYEKLTNDFVIKYDYQAVDELPENFRVFGMTFAK